MINQIKAMEWELSLSEASVFSFIYELPSWADAGFERGEGTNFWYFCAKTKIIEELPLLTSKKDTVYRILKSLDEKRLIDYKFEEGKDWVRLTEKGKQYNQDGYIGKKSEQGRNNIRKGSEKNPTYNSSNDSLISNTETVSPSSQKPIKTMNERKIEFLKLVIDWVIANPGKYPKAMYVEFAKYWVEGSVKRKNVKLRFEDQQYFDIGRRLSTWVQKIDDIKLSKYWEEEKKTGTLNDLFKKQILGINGTQTNTEQKQD